MNILYTNFHHGAGGGHDTYIKSLINGEPNRSNKVHLAVPSSSTLYEWAKESGWGEDRLFPMEFSSKLNLRISEAMRMKRIIEAHDIDIVHTNGSRDTWALIWAKWFSKKSFKIVHTKHNSIPARFSSKVRYNYLCDALIFVSAAIYKTIGMTEFKKTAHVVDLGIDTAYWSRSTPVQAENKVIKLISNAGTGEYKKWINMVKALDLLPEDMRNRFDVAVLGHLGDVEYFFPEYKDFKNVSFPGFVDSKPYLEDSDVGFVLSDRVEMASFACREMMSMSLPVIVSDFSGLPGTVGDTGWITPTNDIEAIAEVLKAILELTPEELLAKKSEARAHAAAHFDIKTANEKHDKIYKNLLNGE